MENTTPEDLLLKALHVFSRDGREKDVAASHACVNFLRGVHSKKISVARARQILEDDNQVQELIEKTREQIRKTSPDMLSSIIFKIREDMTSVLDATHHLENISSNLETTSETMGLMLSKVNQTVRNTSTWPSIAIGAGSSLIASFIYAGFFMFFGHHTLEKPRPDAPRNPPEKDIRHVIRQDHTAPAPPSYYYHFPKTAQETPKVRPALPRNRRQRKKMRLAELCGATS